MTAFRAIAEVHIVQLQTAATGEKPPLATTTLASPHQPIRNRIHNLPGPLFEKQILLPRPLGSRAIAQLERNGQDENSYAMSLLRRRDSCLNFGLDLTKY